MCDFSIEPGSCSIESGVKKMIRFFILISLISFIHGFANLQDMLHPGKLTAGTQKRRWMVQMIFPDFNWVIFQFPAVNFPGCMIFV